MTLAYLLSVLVALVVLAVAICPRRIPAPTPPEVPAAASDAMTPAAQAEVRLILATATQLAARLDTTSYEPDPTDRHPAPRDLTVAA
ncbi:hypothetical protein [Streptomyces sp. NPDC058155]|uniref:hypothetical protein n=1 Tax=Streptomyces sp. NPDC058155 TaxID=3346359 RepID=UPI0036E10B5D